MKRKRVRKEIQGEDVPIVIAALKARVSWNLQHIRIADQSTGEMLLAENKRLLTVIGRMEA